MGNAAGTRAVDVDRFIDLTGLAAIAASLIGLAAARFGVFDALQVWLATALAVLAMSRAGLAGPARGRGRWTDVALIVIVALMFRWPPFWYVFGEQDQGIYVNAAAHLARTGNLLPHDPVLQQATEVGSALARDNYHNGLFGAGIYDAPGSGLEFQFYHLFPLWLALFGGLFDTSAAALGLTVLALLSLVFAYRAACLITGDRRAGLVAGLLLAVNPLHAFFSKYTVSEVPALAFSLISLAFLANAILMPAGRRSTPALALSALAAFCLFLTRISGFMYLPIVLVIGVAALFLIDDRRRGLEIWAWGLTVVGLYVLSILYGLEWSHRYSTDIYRLSFTQALGRNWWVIVAAIAIASMLLYAAAVPLGRAEKSRARVRSLLVDASRFVPLLFAGVLVVVSYQAYRIGFTDAYANDPAVGVRFGVAGAGWEMIGKHALVVYAMYVGPFLALALLGFALLRRSWTPSITALALFVAIFVAQAGLLIRVVAHQPYFARYLLSELVPYSIVFVVACWAAMPTGWSRRLVSGLLGLSVVYGAVLAYQQTGQVVAAGANASLARFFQDVGDHDVVLLLDDRAGNSKTNGLKTALAFSRGLNVATVSTKSLAEPGYLDALEQHFRRVLVLTQGRIADPRFEEIAADDLVVPALDEGSGPVPRLRQERYELHLYRQTSVLRPGQVIPVRARSRAVDWLASGWSAVEAWGVWSLGEGAELLIPGDVLPKGPVVAQLDLQAFVAPGHETQRLSVEVGGAVVATATFVHPDHASAVVDVPLPSGDADAPVRIRLITPDAVSPRDAGVGQDGRVLGVGLRSLRFVPAQATAS